MKTVTVRQLLRARSFNWTDLNGRMIEIYRYIDTLVHQEVPDRDLVNLETLKMQFKVSWTSEISAKDAFEIR